ncbi:MAG: nucleotidyltransferase family protein [Flavobacteriaceae bacterium]|nr:nucleotidyltransferase family protein [Flavobacteriaceae bacterium]
MSEQDPTKASIAILILAAGASSRMGRPKALLNWKGKTLIERVIDLAQSVESSQVMVVLGSDKDKIQKTIRDKSISFVINDNWIMGMGKSISTGVKSIMDQRSNIKGILILLADQPYLSKEILDQLLDIFTSHPNRIAATLYGEERYGVPAIFPAEHFQDLIKLNADQGARDILNDKKIIIHGVKGGDAVFDVDTPEDFKNLDTINPQS